MQDLNVKQMTLAMRTIAEEKALPEDVVLGVIEQAIAAAWRRDNGEREQNVRAELNINDGTAKVSKRLSRMSRTTLTKLVWKMHKKLIKTLSLVVKS